MSSLTKTQLPHLRPDLLDRPALRSRLVQALGFKQLVLLTAPAGFGKTALLVQALTRLPQDMALAWVRCDPDDDIHRFLTSLVEALDPLDVPWTVAPDMLAAIALQDNGLPRVAAELNHALASAEARRGVLALDDVHSVSDPRVLELLELMVEALPPTWTVIISSRSAPRMKLSRLWMQGAVVEFGQEDLRFTQDDVRLLLQAWEAPRDTRAEQLTHETEGWIAGICLSLMAGGGRSATTATRLGRRHMFDYLASEVLAGLPQELRDFLLRCSVLPELSPSRCEALTGDPRAAAWLGEVDRAGLFVTAIDGPEPTLKLHDLFRSFLEDRLREERPLELPGLLERAADSEPDLAHRAEMLLRAGASARVEDVFMEAAATLSIARGTELVRMMERFPQELREASPSLAYMRGLAAWPMMLSGPMAVNMAAAVRGFDERQQPLLALRASAYLALATFQNGRIDEALTLAQSVRARPESADREVQALRVLLELSVSVVRGLARDAAGHLRRLTDLLFGAPAELWCRCMPMMTAFVSRPGYQPALQRFLNEALAAAGDSHLPLRAQAQFHQYNDAVFRGDVARARALIRRVEEDTAWLAQAPRRLAFAQVHLALLEGDGATVKVKIREMIADVLAAAPPRPALARNAIAFYLARQSANLGDWDTVRRVVALSEEQGIFPEGPLYKFPPEILRARLLLHDGDAALARGLLRPLLDGLSDIDHHYTEDYVRVALALAELRCGNAAAAWQVLRPTLDEIAATGNTMRVIMAGTELLAALAAAAWGGAADARKLALLDGWLAQVRNGAVPAAAAPAPLSPALTPPAPPAPARLPEAVLEGLTHRELEVLECLAAGNSNKVIGHTLEVSPNTVKRHVARILDRLGVDSRGEAANWYRRQHTASVASRHA